MKKLILILSFFLIAFTFCNAQEIEMKKVWGGYKYTQNGERLTMNKLVKVMEVNPNALNLVKKAKTKNIIISILSGTGGALIGYQVGTQLGNQIRGERRAISRSLAGIGAGLIVITIPISFSAHKNTKKAVELYNSSFSSTSYYKFNPEFEIGANSNGISLSMKF